MGLLDALFQSDNYGGQGGGLLDFLRQSQMQQANYQPSAGIPQDAPPASFNERFGAQPGAPAAFSPSGRTFNSATFDPSTYAPNQAQPIAVGTYQMPRIGDAGQFQPQQAAIPPNAQPTQGQLPQGQQPPQAPQEAPQQLPPALGGNSFGGNLGASLQSFANTPGGLVQKLVGGTSALFTGQRTDPAGMQQQNLSAQYSALRQALIQNGENPQSASSKAMVAVINPEAAKTIIPELFTNKEKYQVVSEDPLNGKKYGFVNERDQTIDGKPIGQNGGSGSSQPQGLQQLSDMIAAKAAAGASRQELLQEVPSGYRSYVDSVLAGKALPANIGRSQIRGSIMTLAHSIDPSFDETLIPLRTKTATDYAPNGQSGRSIVALNTVQHHIGKLSDDLENVGDTGWTWLNAVRNGIAVNTPIDPKQGKAVQAIQDDIKAVTDEMSAAYKAGRVSDHEIEAWNKLANSNLPLRQLKQGIYDFVGLLNGKRDQLNETHQAILGKEAPGINRDLNEEITKRVTNRNSGTTSQPAASIQEGATATNPQTGQKITFRNGKWQ